MATVNAEAQGSGSSQGRAAPSVRLRLGDSYDSYLKLLNPSAWWKLADAVGSATALDSSGNGYTGTVNGGVTFGQPGPIAAAPQDTAALFDGSTGHVNTTFNPTGSISVLAWLNLAGLSQNGDPRIVANDHTDADNAGFELLYNRIAGDVPTFYVGNGTGNTAATGSAALPTSGWLMLVGTYDESTVRLYLDGDLLDSQPLSGPMTAGTKGVAIGFDPAYSGDYTHGSIAEVAIFPYALSAAQISQLYSLAPSSLLGVAGRAFSLGQATVTTPAVGSGSVGASAATGYGQPKVGIPPLTPSILAPSANAVVDLSTAQFQWTYTSPQGLAQGGYALRFMAQQATTWSWYDAATSSLVAYEVFNPSSAQTATPGIPPLQNGLIWSWEVAVQDSNGLPSPYSLPFLVTGSPTPVVTPTQPTGTLTTGSQTLV